MVIIIFIVLISVDYFIDLLTFIFVVDSLTFYLFDWLSFSAILQFCRHGHSKAEASPSATLSHQLLASIKLVPESLSLQLPLAAHQPNPFSLQSIIHRALSSVLYSQRDIFFTCFCLFKQLLPTAKQPVPNSITIAIPAKQQVQGSPWPSLHLQICNLTSKPLPHLTAASTSPNQNPISPWHCHPCHPPSSPPPSMLLIVSLPLPSHLTVGNKKPVHPKPAT